MMDLGASARKRKRMVVISSDDDDGQKQDDRLHKENDTNEKANVTLKKCEIILSPLKQKQKCNKDKRAKRIISQFADDSSDDGTDLQKVAINLQPKHCKWKKNLEKLCEQKKNKKRASKR